MYSTLQTLCKPKILLGFLIDNCFSSLSIGAHMHDVQNKSNVRDKRKKHLVNIQPEKLI